MKILLCAVILICTSAIGVSVYKNSLRKLALLEAFRSMFFQFEAFIGIEHCEFAECVRRYASAGDAAAPILLKASERMRNDRRAGPGRAMRHALEEFASENKGVLEEKDVELIAHTCGELGGMGRGHITEVLERAGGLLERRIAECRERDVKNGKLMNQLGVIIGIVIVILII